MHVLKILPFYPHLKNVILVRVKKRYYSIRILKQIRFNLIMKKI